MAGQPVVHPALPKWPVSQFDGNCELEGGGRGLTASSSGENLSIGGSGTGSCDLEAAGPSGVDIFALYSTVLRRHKT